MRKKIAAKAKRELERRFGKPASNRDEYHNHLDFRGLPDFTDEAFFYVMENVRGVNMLDLNETAVTNESITFLTNLEYVNELRAKECINLDNNCAESLNQLKSLVFLHVKSTNITIDGLLRLTQLSNLKTLMFSADDLLAIKEKLVQLKTMLPQCEVVINSKPYVFSSIDLFVNALKGKQISYRLKIKNQPLALDWSTWLTRPSASYLEAARQGNYRINDIEWIDINPIEQRIQGKLIPAKNINHSPIILTLLNNLDFVYTTANGIISTYILEKEIY